MSLSFREFVLISELGWAQSETFLWLTPLLDLPGMPGIGGWARSPCSRRVARQQVGWGMVRSTVRMGSFLFFKPPLFFLFLRIPMTYLDEVFFNFHRALTKKSGHWIRIRGHSCMFELATVSFTLELFVLGGALWIVYWLIISIISYAFTAEAFVSASILYVNHDQ